jgi:hypothetical protein
MVEDRHLVEDALHVMDCEPSRSPAEELKKLRESYSREWAQAESHEGDEDLPLREERVRFLLELEREFAAV